MNSYLRTTPRREFLNGLGVAAISGLVGVLFGILALGTDIVDLWRTDWITGDTADFYIAWRQYINDPEAHSLKSNMLGYPFLVDLALFDPMPLFLLMAKWIAPDDIEGLQFIGAYFVLSLGLQGIFGGLIVREISKSRQESFRGKTFVQVLLSLFFVSTPFTYTRFGHVALASHWLLPMGIWIAIKSRHLSTNQWLLWNVPLVILSCGVSPYLAFMVVMNCLVYKAFTSWRDGMPQLLGLSVAILGIAGISFYLFGFAGAASIDGGGYGHYSMNALGPIDSNGRALLLPLDIADATGGQSGEGLNYLGAGTFIMILSACVAAAQSRTNARQVPVLGFVVVLIISYVLALSTKPSFGSHIVNTHAPALVVSALSRLRASGRLFWIGGFATLTIALVLVYSHMRPKALLLLTAIALPIQLIDISRIVYGVNHGIHNLPRYRFSTERNGIADSGYKAVIVQPPWQCDPHGSPGGLHGFEYFGMYAAINHLPTNSFYAGRNPKRFVEDYCAHLPLMEPPVPGNLYVLSGSVYGKNRNLFANFSCRLLEETHVDVLCVDRPQVLNRDKVEQFDLDNLYRAKPGVPVFFGTPRSASAFPEVGWSVPEPWGTWSGSDFTTISIEKNAEPVGSIKFHARAFLPSKDYVQHIDVSVNGIFVSSVRLSASESEFEVKLPLSVQKETTLTVEFRLLNAISPLSAGISKDARKLALGLVSYVLIQ